MKKIKLYSLIFWIMISSSCTYVYYPTYPVLPDAKNNGFGLQGTLGLTKAQISGWYNVDSNFYVVGQIAGAISAIGDGDTTTNRPFNSKAFLVGLGYSKFLSDKINFSVQGGGGIAQGFFRTTIFNKDDGTTPSPFSALDINTQSYRGFLQPSVGFIKKSSAFYIIPKVTYESFNKVITETGKKNLPNRDFLLTEFFMMGRFYTKTVNIELYGGIAINTSLNNQFVESYIAQPIVFGFGVSKTFAR